MRGEGVYIVVQFDRYRVLFRILILPRSFLRTRGSGENLKTTGAFTPEGTISSLSDSLQYTALQLVSTLESEKYRGDKSAASSRRRAP